MAIRTDYQTVLEIDTATPIREGKMRADGGDIRVYGDAAHTDPLDFYIDPTTLNTTQTKVYIKQDLPSGRYHPGIAHYWPLDGDGTDLVGTVTGTLSGGGGGPTSVTGQVDQALNFVRTNGQYIDIAGIVPEWGGKSQASFEAWIKLSQLPSTAGGNYIIYINRDFDGGIVDKFYFRFGTSNVLNLSTATTNSDNVTLSQSPATINQVQRWYHIAATTDLVGGVMRIYIDGEQVAETTGQSWNNDEWSVGTADTYRISTANTSFAFDGEIDNAAHYWRALTAEEVRSSYLRGRAGKRLQEPTPTAYWTFNSSDNAGSEVIDLVSGLNGTIAGGVTIGKPGRVGQAFDFNGTDGRVVITDSALMEPHVGVNGTSTWAMTVKIDNSANTVLSKDGVTGSTREFAIAFGTDNMPVIRMYDPTAANFTYSQSRIGVPAGEWVHLTCTYDQSISGTFEKAKWYINGDEVSTFESLSNGTFTQFTSTASSLLVGARQEASPSLLFGGDISDVLWSNIVLSDAQIAELARRSREGLRPDLTDTNLDILAYWSFDNRDIGREPQDVFGTAHLTIQNDSVGTEIIPGRDAPTGEAFTFVGQGSGTGSTQPYVGDLTPGTSVLSPGTSSTSIAAWVKLASSRAGGQFHYIISRYGNDATEASLNEYDLYVNGDDEASFFLRSDASATSVLVASQSPLSINTWHHLVGVLDKSNNTVYLYVDGALSNTADATGVGSIDFANDTPLTIGNFYETATSAVYSLDGDVGGIGYYTEALTAEQVDDLYQKGQAGDSVLSDAKRVYITYGDTSKTSASSAANTFVREITGLVHAYNFDEENGGNVLDSSGEDNGTLIGSAKVENGITGLARNLNSEAVIDFSTQNIPTGAASIVTRFRTTTANQVLWSNYDGYADNAGLALEITSGGVLRARHSVGAGSDNALATGTTRVDDGVLHTAIVTKNDSVLSVYLDGYVVEATDTMNSADIAPDANLRIGGYKDIGFVAPAGLVLQLEADGYTALDDNGRVIIWGDPVDTNATQTIAANRPFYIANGIGGRPAIDFSTDGWRLNLSSQIDLQNSDFTVFTVLQPSEDLDQTSTVSYLLSSDDTWRGFIHFGNLSAFLTNEALAMIASDGANTYGTAINNTTFSAGSPFIATFGLSGSTQTIRVAATGQTIVDSSDGPLNSASSRSVVFDYLGGRPTGGQSLRGQVSAVYIFDRKLNDSDTEYVERYLALKYGVTNDLVAGAPRANASFDEMRVFDKVLSTDEIGDLMDNFAQVAGSRVQVRKRNDPEPVLNSSL